MTDKSLQFIFDNSPHLVDERDALLGALIRFADGLIADGARPFCLQAATDALAAMLNNCHPKYFPSRKQRGDLKDHGGWRGEFKRTRPAGTDGMGQADTSERKTEVVRKVLSHFDAGGSDAAVMVADEKAMLEAMDWTSKATRNANVLWTEISARKDAATLRMLDGALGTIWFMDLNRLGCDAIARMTDFIGPAYVWPGGLDALDKEKAVVVAATVADLARHEKVHA